MRIVSKVGTPISANAHAEFTSNGKFKCNSPYFKTTARIADLTTNDTTKSMSLLTSPKEMLLCDDTNVFDMIPVSLGTIGGEEILEVSTVDEAVPVVAVVVIVVGIDKAAFIVVAIALSNVLTFSY